MYALINSIGSIVTLSLIVSILLFSIKSKTKILDSFISGALDGLNCILSITPILVALITAVSMLKSSGLMGFITNLIEPMTGNLPPECISLALMKPISGSGANAFLYSTLKSFGSESRIGNIASTIVGSSETILYIISTYCGSIGFTETADIIVISIVSFFFSVICATLIN